MKTRTKRKVWEFVQVVSFPVWGMVCYFIGLYVGSH